MVVITTPLTTHSGIQDIFIAEANKYAIVATVSGIEYINLHVGAVVSSGIIPGGYPPLCVAADWTVSSGLLYVGTSGGGIFTTRYHPARAPGLDFTGSFIQHLSTATTPPLSDDVIYDLDVRPGRLLIGTGAGVDFIHNLNKSATRSLLSGTRDVHLTDGNGGYWTTTSSVEVKYDLISTTGTGIIGIDFEYTVDSNPALPGAGPTDLAISEGSPRLLGFATPSGAFVLEEQPFAESTAQKKTFVPLNEFVEEPEPVFISLDFSANASIDSGFLYATTTGTLRVFHLINETLSGTHPQKFATAYRLTGGVARDQTLVTGTMSLVRTTSVA